MSANTILGNDMFIKDIFRFALIACTLLPFLLACQYINKDKVNFEKVTVPRVELPFFSTKETPPVKATLIPSASTVTNRFVLKFYSLLERKKYNVFRFTYSTAKVISESENTVTAYYYKPKKIKGKVPLILVFPILDGDHLVCEWQSKILANYGFAVIRFEKKKGFLKTDAKPEFHREVLQQTIIDARRALDWACTWPEIDTQKIGVTGVSLGGISASLLMAADDRIYAGAFFLFGGNLPKIIATSKEPNVVKLRAQLLIKTPLPELEEYLYPFYKDVDPLTYADRLDPARVLMVSANRDKVIIPSVTKDIWHKIGEPPWIKIPFVGHISAAAYFFYGNKRMAKFFKKQFKDKK